MNDFEKAQKLALRMLAVRARTEKEIKTRLETKKFSREVINLVLDSLKKNNLLSDLEFARSWIDNRIQFRLRSKKVLKLELKDKGVSDSIISEALEERSSELEDKKIAVKLIERKLNAGTNLQDAKLKQKMFRFLVNKGINSEVAEEVILERLESSG